MEDVTLPGVRGVYQVHRGTFGIISKNALLNMTEVQRLFLIFYVEDLKKLPKQPCHTL